MATGRTVTQDLIVVISSSGGWKYPLARLLVDDTGQAAVFVKRGQPPVQTFDVDPSALNQRGQLSAVRGTFSTGTDETITYRRRGASCGWALAKCNVKTPALTARWPDADEPSASSTPITATVTPPSPQSTEPKQRDVRAWAREHGYTVPTRGALKPAIVQAYKAAHGLS